MKHLALFDFDGTITKRDSFLAFLIFASSPWGFVSNSVRALPALMRLVLGITSAHDAKEKVFSLFFSGMPIDEFDMKVKAFYQEKMPSLLRQQAIEKLKHHLVQKHIVSIVSASPDRILKHYCESNGFELIATVVQVKGNTVTGKFSSPNCKGEEKVRRIMEQYDLEAFDYIYAYGDTPSDRAFMAIADESHYKQF